LLFAREELGRVAEKEETGGWDGGRYYGKTPLALPPLSRTPFVLGPILL